MDLLELYFEMRRRWEEIILQPITWNDKQEACLALLVVLVDELATARVGQPNAPVRFFADMERLSRLMFGRIDGEVDEIATYHARLVVNDWLRANAFGNATKSIGGPVDVDRHLDYAQLRPILLGEERGWPALDPVRARSDYVQAILRRVTGEDITHIRTIGGSERTPTGP